MSGNTDIENFPEAVRVLSLGMLLFIVIASFIWWVWRNYRGEITETTRGYMFSPNSDKLATKIKVGLHQD